MLQVVPSIAYGSAHTLTAGKDRRSDIFVQHWETSERTGIHAPNPWNFDGQ